MGSSSPERSTPDILSVQDVLEVAGLVTRPKTLSRANRVQAHMEASLGQVRRQLMRWYAEGLLPFSSDTAESQGFLMEQTTPENNVFSASLQWGGAPHIIEENHHFYPGKSDSFDGDPLAQRVWAFAEPETGGVIWSTTEGRYSKHEIKNPTTRLLELHKPTDDSLDGLQLTSIISDDGVNMVAYFPQKDGGGRYVYNNGEAEVEVRVEISNERTTFIVEGEVPEWASLHGIKHIYQKHYGPHSIGVVMHNDQQEVLLAVMINYDENGNILEIQDVTKRDGFHTFANKFETF